MNPTLKQKAAVIVAAYFLFVATLLAGIVLLARVRVSAVQSPAPAASTPACKCEPRASTPVTNPWPRTLDVVCPHCRNRMTVYPGFGKTVGEKVAAPK